jgi:hypothetical protein
VSARKQHEIWIDQCGATETIKARYGLKAAFDYVVGEKLINFASAATKHPEFARELPRFVSEVRRMFTPEEIRIHTARLERDQSEKAADDSDDDELYLESQIAAVERIRQFTTLKELLTAPELGTS